MNMLSEWNLFLCRGLTVYEKVVARKILLGKSCQLPQN